MSLALGSLLKYWFKVFLFVLTFYLVNCLNHSKTSIVNILESKILNNIFTDRDPNRLNFDIIEKNALDAYFAKVF